MQQEPGWIEDCLVLKQWREAASQRLIIQAASLGPVSRNTQCTLGLSYCVYWLMLRRASLQTGAMYS
jgi:hypothetical protein